MLLSAQERQTFVPGAGNMLCVMTMAINDSFVEDPESYRVLVNSNDPAVVISDGTRAATITIRDSNSSNNQLCLFVRVAKSIY